MANDWLTECEAWCRQVKYIAPMGGHKQWRHKQPNTRWLKAVVLDTRRQTLPHLYFKAEYRVRKRSGIEAYDFQLLWHGQSGFGQHRRVLCVEIDDPSKVAHREPDGTEVFGTHVQLGDMRAGGHCVRQWRVPSDRDYWRAWARRFCRLARIGHNEEVLLPPLGGDIFQES